MAIAGFMESETTEWWHLQPDYIQVSLSDCCRMSTSGPVCSSPLKAFLWLILVYTYRRPGLGYPIQQQNEKS
jgi:hypothetical protein